MNQGLARSIVDSGASAVSLYRPMQPVFPVSSSFAFNSAVRYGGFARSSVNLFLSLHAPVDAMSFYGYHASGVKKEELLHGPVCVPFRGQENEEHSLVISSLCATSSNSSIGSSSHRVN